MAVVHLLPWGNIVLLDHFCLNSDMDIDGDVQGCMVIPSFCYLYSFAVLSSITHRKKYARIFYRCKEHNQAVWLIPSDSEDSDLEPYSLA